MAQITSRLEELGQLRIVDLKKLLLDNGLPTNGKQILLTIFWLLKKR